MLDNKIKYGRLRLIDSFIKPGAYYMRYWNCECDCGKLKTIREDAIRLKKTESCGCLGKEKRYKGWEDLSGIYWNSVKRGAKSRNFEFSITIEDAWNKFIEQNKKCWLTGRDIKLIRNISGNKKNRNLNSNKDSHWFEQTASLDRIDSTKGYIIENICWLHKDINMFKSDMHSDDFIKLCHEVVNYQKVKLC